jgi:hypothetical protein
MKDPEITAATSASLDGELARQLRELIASESTAQPGRAELTGALVEAGVWALATVGAWILVVQWV